MSGDIQFAVGVLFAAPLAGGVTSLLGVLHELGATMVGRHSPRVPFEIALEMPPLFAYGERAWASSSRGWVATLYLAPYTGLNLAWPEAQGGAWQEIDAVYDRLTVLGNIEFAIADRVLVREHDPSRVARLSHFNADRYAKRGPFTLGARTLIGTRVLELVEPAIRGELIAAGHLDARGLTLGSSEWSTTDAGRGRRAALAARFETSSIVRSVTMDNHGIVHSDAGPGWVPLPPGPPPAALPRGTAGAIKKLRAGKGELELAGLLAPFAELNQIEVLDVDLEGAKLPLSLLKASIFQDVGAVGADLRGCDAQNSQWLESTLEGADLRWADFTNARFPITSLDRANAAYAVFTDAEVLESAEGACFDHVTALRWKPDAPEFPANMAGATFRKAVLRDATFAGTNLSGAVFDGADLSGATFTGAKLRGATFRGATLTGTTFSNCELEGAVFDPAAP